LQPHGLDAVAADGDLDGDQVLSAPGDRPRPRRLPARAFFILGLLVVPILLGTWWWLWRVQRQRIVQRSATAALVPNAGVPDPTGGPAIPPSPAAAPAAAAAADKPAPAGPDDAAAPDADPHPHPITPAHLRIQRENNLIGALNGAMDAGDAVGLRGLLDQYRSEFPEDPNLLQPGYQIIADCLQYPGAASKAAGQSYFERERGSILRRFVARHCQLP
jgi:hypothetical protein